MKNDTPIVPAAIEGSRRHALGALGSIGLLALTGCGGGGSSSDGSSTSALAAIVAANTAGAPSTTTSTTTATAAGTTAATTTTTGTTTTTTTATTDTATSTSCTVVPEETAGPYPADGSNASNANYNVLALSGIVRSDIRTNLGSTAQVGGVPLTLALTLTGSGCTPLAGYAIYLWHCTREGTYSVYTTQSLVDNHLRGVQETDAGGNVRFVTVVPGCYAGRMPHMHLEVYRSLATATAAGNKIKTTQLAFPTETLRAVYATAAGYSQSTSNLNGISFATDNVFSDGTAQEMVSLSGNVDDGYSASISIAIAA